MPKKEVNVPLLYRQSIESMDATDDLLPGVTATVSDITKREKVQDISITSIDDFPEHPFKVKDDDSMQALADSVKAFGIQTPAVVRPKDDNRYEMVNGHRRKRACELAELETIPCIIRQLSPDEAAIVLVDSNLQREIILPSERAKSYKMRLDALKRQAGRPGRDNSSQSGTNYRSDEELAKMTGDSRSQIHRYIRLLDLIPQFLEMVDDGVIAMSGAEALLQIPGEEQTIVYDALRSSTYTMDTKKAEALRQSSKAKPLDHKEVKLILSGAKESKKVKHTAFKLKPKIVSRYFKPEQKPDEIESIIIKALDLYYATNLGNNHSEQLSSNIIEKEG